MMGDNILIKFFWDFCGCFVDCW